MAKSPKSYRLSDQALDSLQWLTSKTGTNETAIIEMSIAFLKQKFEVVLSGPEKIVSNVAVPVVDLQKKKRKRR